MNAVRRKVALYLSAGVRVVWLVEPAVRMITVYEPDARPISLIAGDKLVGGAILPGFEVAIEDLFPSRTASTSQTVDPQADVIERGD
jgi:Uma2 family endonuclease